MEKPTDADRQTVDKETHPLKLTIKTNSLF